MDRLLAMQTFVRVAETGNFSAVAREQHTTQSAVSKQIAALEKHLGAKLITRTTRSVAVTENGKRYLADVRRLLSEVADAESQLRRSEGQLGGLVRLAAPVGFGARVLMPHLCAFLGAHPSLKIDLRLSDCHIDLVENGIDLAIRIGALPDSTLVARRVGHTCRVPLASRAYLESLPAGRASPRTPSDLRDHACIVYTEVATKGVWTFFAADGTPAQVRVDGPLQTDSSEGIRASVLKGLGIGYAPKWLFDDVIANGEVRVLLPEWRTQTLPIHLVSPPERKQSVTVRAVGESIAIALASA